MIKKVIHYVWVGKNPLSDLAKACIESWKKFMPCCEIIQWDETNFDVNANQYCKETYETEKWAFCSDYIRLYVLYKHGGIYMDTDLELIKPIEQYLNHKAFLSFENANYFQSGLIATESENLWIKHLLDFYNNKKFIKANGKMDLTPNTTTITVLSKEMYPELRLDNTEQHLDNFSIYPKEIFCANEFAGKVKIMPETCSIHHYAGSWVPKTFSFKFKQFVKNFIGTRNVQIIRAKKAAKQVAAGEIGLKY